MNAQFEECLKRKRIQEFSEGKSCVQKELTIAEKDLKEATKTFNYEQYKWSTIQSYYSMFHSARALLHAKNYREKSHYCLIVALRALYVEKQLLPCSLIESLQNAKRLREEADYVDEWSKYGASTLLKEAEKFLSMSRKLVSSKV